MTDLELLRNALNVLRSDLLDGVLHDFNVPSPRGKEERINAAMCALAEGAIDIQDVLCVALKGDLGDMSAVLGLDERGTVEVLVDRIDYWFRQTFDAAETCALESDDDDELDEADDVDTYDAVEGELDLSFHFVPKEAAQPLHPFQLAVVRDLSARAAQRSAIRTSGYSCASQRVAARHGLPTIGLRRACCRQIDGSCG